MTYIPTQKSDIICECLLSKAQSVFKYVPLVACLYIDANLPVLLLYIKYCVAISIAVANLHKILLLKILVAKSVKYEIQIHMNSSNGFEIFHVSVLQIIFHTILSMLLSFLKVKMIDILDQMLCTIGDSGFFRLQGIVKTTVSGVVEDLNFKILEGSDPNWCFPDSAETAN